MEYNLGTIYSPTAYGAGSLEASKLISNVVAAVFSTVGLLFLLYLIFGAFKYITAGGDDKGVLEAKKILTNAAVGLSLTVGSFFIADIAGEVLGLQFPGISGITAPAFFGPTGYYILGILNPTQYGTGAVGSGTPSSRPVGELINNLTTAAFTLAGILLLVYLFFGAFKYITAGGDDKATGAAKNILTHAVIGLFIMVAAFFIVKIVGTVLGLPDILNPVFPGP